MKKKILIGLSILTVGLVCYLGCLSLEENKYSDEKYRIETEDHEGHDHEEYEVEQSVINNESSAEDTEEVALIPELEDLSAPEYETYSLFHFSDLKTIPAVTEGTINYGSETKDFKVTAKTENNFHLFKGDTDSVNYYDFYNETGNVVGNILYLDEAYTEEYISELYLGYKETDQKFDIHGYYDSYDFGEIQDFEYNGLKGVYNKTVEGMYDEGIGVVRPETYRYIAYLNYNGKIVNISLITYKNCTYGQMDFETLIDKAIEF